MKYLFAFLVAFFIIILCCCIVSSTYNYVTYRNAKSEFGKNFNSQRVQMGIPIIPASWELRNVLNNRITWGFEEFSEAGDPPYPRYSQKQIVIADDSTIHETDYYQGSQEKVRSDGDRIRDEIEITCIYTFADRKITECYARYSTFERDSNISREEAKEILKAWGIEYP